MLVTTSWCFKTFQFFFQAFMNSIGTIHSHTVYKILKFPPELVYIFIVVFNANPHHIYKNLPIIRQHKKVLHITKNELHEMEITPKC